MFTLIVMIILFIAILTSVILYYKYGKDPIIKTEYDNFNKTSLYIYTPISSDRQYIINSMIKFTEQYSTDPNIKIVINK